MCWAINISLREGTAGWVHKGGLPDTQRVITDWWPFVTLSFPFSDLYRVYVNRFWTSETQKGLLQHLDIVLFDGLFIIQCTVVTGINKVPICYTRLVINRYPPHLAWAIKVPQRVSYDTQPSQSVSTFPAGERKNLICVLMLKGYLTNLIFCRTKYS